MLGPNECPACGAKCSSVENLLGHMEWAARTKGHSPEAHRRYVGVMQQAAQREKEKSVEHVHDYKPVPGRPDLVVLYCASCGDIKVTQLPAQREQPHVPRILPMVPDRRFPLPERWPPSRPTWIAGTNICRGCGERQEMLQDESTCLTCKGVSHE